MSKDWTIGSGYCEEPKVTVGPGINKDGSATGGVSIEATNSQESQTGDVRGTKALRKDKKPVKATWYQVMWLSAIKLAVSAGSKIYANKQRTKRWRNVNSWFRKSFQRRRISIMSKDWTIGSGYCEEPKVTVGPGITKDGSATGGVEIEATNPQESKTVQVKGTKRMLASKSKKATWY